MAAADAFDSGAIDAQVAHTYRVTRMSAWRWHHAYETGGREALYYIRIWEYDAA